MDPSSPGRFSRRFWPLYGLGLVGVASLPLLLVPTFRALPLPAEAPPLSVLLAASLVQTALLLAACVALGAALAPRVGLRSLLAERVERGRPLGPALRADLLPALAVGLGLTLATVLLDRLTLPALGDAGPALTEQPRTVASTVAGVLYGGITEELMVRWGLVSLFAWAGARLTRRTGRPGAGVLWAAVVLAALLFGAFHLPAVALQTPLTPPLVLRTVGLNALLGLGFGALYGWRSLEAAMIAHATFHVVLTALAWTGLA